MEQTFPPSPYFSDLALMQATGETLKADVLLAALNKINRAFGKPDYLMPPAMKPLRDGMYIADARKVSPAQFLSAMNAERFGFDLEAKPSRDRPGFWEVAA